MFLNKVGLWIWKAISFPWTLHQWLTKSFVSGTLPLLDSIGLIIVEITLFCFCSFCLGLLLRVIGPVLDAVLMTIGILWGVFLLVVVIYLWIIPPYRLLNVFIRIGWTWVLFVCGVFQYLMIVMIGYKGN